jgi:hypothetical protein
MFAARLTHPGGRRAARLGFLALALAASISMLAAGRALPSAPLPAALSSARVRGFETLPTVFEANAGQAEPEARFIARTPHGAIRFGLSAVALVPGEGEGLGIIFVGASPEVLMRGDEALPGTVSYFVGPDPSHWLTGLPTYEAVRYEGLYPGVDLEYRGRPDTLKGTYTVAPGANPAVIAWTYSGAASVEQDDAGNLHIATAGGREVVESAPVAWQDFGGEQVPVAARYALHGGTVSFELSAYDPALPLVIDPELAYSTYLGGAQGDDGTGIAVDAAGNVYVTGFTTSDSFPFDGAEQKAERPSIDVYVAKMNAQGTDYLYTAYLSGTGDEVSWCIAVDEDGAAYVTGYTRSTDFPLANAFQAENLGGSDTFVSQLSPDGTSLNYSTYLGGGGDDEGWGIAVSGDTAIVGGTTRSANFPTHNALQPESGGGRDNFVTRFSAAGSSLIYSTYLGGSGHEDLIGMASDTAGNAFVTGGSYSDDYPVVGAYQPRNGGDRDVVVSKIGPNGSTLVYSTYLGGAGDDLAWAIAVWHGEAFVTGFSGSADFPVRRAAQPVKGNNTDGFVTRLSSSGSWLVYSTFLGGNGSYDAPYGIGVQPDGSASVAGFTQSTDFPVANAIQPQNAGLDDAFVSKLGPLGGPLLFSTYLGGSLSDFSYGAAVDPAGNIYTTGTTHSADFPVANAHQPQNGGDHDSFITKIEGANGPPPTATTCPVQFPDVPPGSAFYAYVRCLACEGIVQGFGDGTFGPGLPVTRSQLAKIVANSAGYYDSASEQTFADVPPGSTFYPYVERLAARAIVTGYACGGAGEPCDPAQRPYFRPGGNVTRGQAAKMADAAARLPAPLPGTQTFEDVPPASPFYQWVEPLAAAGLVSGYACGGEGEPCGPGSRSYFRPGVSVTRGQAAKLASGLFLRECAGVQAGEPGVKIEP